MTVVASHSNCLAILFEHSLNVTKKLLEDIAVALGIEPAGSVSSAISVQPKAEDDAGSISLVPERSVSSAGEVLTNRWIP
jgi:microsomal dipeptidase-like Zn-dependent dipeptidase